MPTQGYRKGQLPTPLLTFQDTTEYLRLSPSRLNTILREDSSFPAHKVGGEWRFIAEDVEDWVRTHTKRLNKYTTKPVSGSSSSRIASGKSLAGKAVLPTNISEMTEDEFLASLAEEDMDVENDLAYEELDESSIE